MSNTNDQKIRLLILYDLLQSKTDESHTLSTQEIIDELAKRGINVGQRQTIYDDISVLNEYGYEVICERSRSNRYYIASRKFERPEVQILLSAVSASRFLSNKKTAVLVQKLLELLGIGEADELKVLVPDNYNKHNNERIYYNVDALVAGITQKKKVSFLYFDYGLNGKREYRKDKERYIVNPLGLAYSEDKLYLICYHDKYGNAVNYRIDRMDEVQVEKEEIAQSKEFEKFDLNKYRREQFNMYGGNTETVELSFPHKLLEVFIDRFGEDINIRNASAEEYAVKVTVQISKTFFAWLTTFEGEVKIISPLAVKEKYKDFINKISENL